jgi:phospholipase/carboxylesterase
MKKIVTDLVYKSLEPRRASGTKSPVIILLHGRGADENDLLGLSQYLDDRLMVFSVRAPIPFEFGGYTYFQLNDDGTAEPRMLLESYRKLLNFVDGVGSLPGVDAGKIYLLGFSMGTIMSYALALTNPAKFAGVIAQSGFVREHPDLEFQWKHLEGCPFMITHGIQDTVIPVSLARKTKAMFAKSNSDFVYKEYPMGHEISGESLADVSGWLQKRLG